MLLRVIDFESTGLPPDAAIVEVGWCDVIDGVVGEQGSMLVNPKRPIGIEAMAVHHIRDHEVAHAPAIDLGFRRLMQGSPDVFVAHNAEFEEHFFSGGGRPWICTLKVARRLWPDAPRHTNSVLRYYLELDLDEERAMPPHRAAPDAYVTAHILAKALPLASIDDMVKWTKQPSLLPRCTFGQHSGKTWDEVPTNYLTWMAGNEGMDSDKRYTARHHLKMRGVGQQGRRAS
jgi:exodeoxyribonuclease X